MPSDMPMGGGAPPPQGAPPAPAAPGGMPPQGQTPPPTGPTGATMPVPNQGLQMRAVAKLAELAQGMQMILAVLPVGSDLSNDVADALNKIRKHLKPGAEQGGAATTEKQLGAMQQRQAGPQQIASLRAMGGPAAPPAAPGGPPPAT